MFKNSVFKVSVDTKKWAKAAVVRAIRTFGQTAAAGIVVGLRFDEVNWKATFSVALVATIASLINSLGGIPEVESEE